MLHIKHIAENSNGCIYVQYFTFVAGKASFNAVV